MAGITGTHDVSSLLASNIQSAAAFGLDTITAVVEEDTAAWNLMVNQMLDGFIEVTTDRQRVTGASTNGTMIEVDEYGRGPTQRENLPTTMGFPLRKFQYPIGWTRLWLETHTPRDMMLAMQAAQKAHMRKIMGAIKTAIYLSGNYSFPDFLVDNITMNVKRFTNADSSPIPNGPNGEVFTASTHTHYLANASLTAATALAAINTVIEHGYGGEVKVYINAADAAAWQALTGFISYLDPRVALPNAVTAATAVSATRLDITRLDNRAIGIFGAAEVWVKPWGIPNYAFIFDISTPNKPLVFRQREQETLQGLRLAAELDAYPLHAQYWEAEFGVAVWTRLNGAVFYYAGGSYVDPTITGY